MQNADSQGLSLEELRNYEGFQDMNMEELEKALEFIELMAELLHTIS